MTRLSYNKRQQIRCFVHVVLLSFSYHTHAGPIMSGAYRYFIQNRSLELSLYFHFILSIFSLDFLQA